MRQYGCLGPLNQKNLINLFDKKHNAPQAFFGHKFAMIAELI